MSLVHHRPTPVSSARRRSGPRVPAGATRPTHAGLSQAGLPDTQLASQPARRRRQLCVPASPRLCRHQCGCAKAGPDPSRGRRVGDWGRRADDWELETAGGRRESSPLPVLDQQMPPPPGLSVAQGHATFAAIIRNKRDCIRVSSKDIRACGR
jgi:hypothetical protein